MDKLLTQAPEAHQHLAGIEDESLQQQLGAKLMTLTHSGLVNEKPGWDGVTDYELIPEADFSPEQIGQQEQIIGLMVGAARYVSEAAQELEEQHQRAEKTYSPDASEVLDLAKHKAAQHAEEAKKAGDGESAVAALESMLTIGLIADDRSGRLEEISRVIAADMGEDLLEAIDTTSGLVAIGAFGDSVKTTPERLQRSANFIRVATNIDFNDDFGDRKPLVRPGNPVKDVQRRTEIIKQLKHDELTALARIAAEIKHNPFYAAGLSLQAMELLVSPESAYLTDDETIADTIAHAAEHVVQAKDENLTREFNSRLADLRDRRSAGLKPYRMNVQITGALDRAIIHLVKNGKLELAKALLTASPHEIAPEGVEDRGNTNFDLTINSDKSLTEDQKASIKANLRLLHSEKVKELTERLRANGAAESTIEAIISYSIDPDSAADVAPEFWTKYKEIKNMREEKRYYAGGDRTWQVSRSLFEVIEGSDSRQIAEYAELISDFLQVGLRPEQISEHQLRLAMKFEDSKAQEQYISGLVDIAKKIEDYAVSSDSPWFRKEAAFDMFSEFENPKIAFEFAEKIFGAVAPEKANGFKQRLTGETSSFEIVAIPTETIEIFESVAEHELAKSNPEAVFNALTSHGFNTEEAEILIDALNTEGLGDIVAAMTDEGARQLIEQVIEDEDPGQRAIDAVYIYDAAKFIADAGITIDFSAHLDEWANVLRSIPEGRAGEQIRSQMISRLLLNTGENPIGEDPVQAIRIFSEVTVSTASANDLYDTGLELIEQLCAADSIRGFPSAKPTKLSEIFYDSELGELYKEIYRLKQTGDAEGLAEIMAENSLLAPEEAIELTEFVSALKQKASVVHEQEHAAKKWLNQYSTQNIKAVRLIAAWQARKLVIEHGREDIKDSPSEILDFVLSQGVELVALRALEAGQTDVTLEELEAQSAYIQEIGARYSPQTTFEAIERIIKQKRQGGLPLKKVREAKGLFTVGEREFQVEILGADDPRGFTIGYDTGCCMTLGGLSESCIWAGYEDGRYSFFAVYDDDGRLRAQSIMYLSEEEGRKILVVDNIEANSGTNLGPIAEIYRNALTEFAENQGLELDAIQIGTGYSPEAVIGNLPDASIAPRTPLKGTYSDASIQKILWSRPAPTSTPTT